MRAAVNGTADVWRERVVAQQLSGQSIRAWCKAHACHEHGFYWWRSRLGLSPRSRAKRQRREAKPVKFAEVVVDGTASEPICLRLAAGRELILPESIPVEHVARLVRAIEAQA